MASDLDRDCYEILTLCACEALRRTSRAVTALYQEDLRETEVRAAQLPILVGAQLMGPAPITALADALVMDRTTLTRNLKGLEAQGLIVLGSDGDRRVRLVILTDKGRSALQTAVVAWHTSQARVETLVGEHRVRALVADLATLTEAVRG
jgi:DNA-binding MarR family transcriptional regulator